jgi:hypothetical protein
LATIYPKLAAEFIFSSRRKSVAFGYRTTSPSILKPQATKAALAFLDQSSAAARSSDAMRPWNSTMLEPVDNAKAPWLVKLAPAQTK